MKSKTEKRTDVLYRLRNQLSSGVKVDQESKQEIPLTDSDKERITKEIKVLEERVPLNQRV